MAKCKNCGKELVGQQRSFCGRACRNKFYVTSDMLEAKIPKVCKSCGKDFLAYRANARYCSQQCGWRMHDKRRRDRYPRPKRAQGEEWKQKRKTILAEYGFSCWLCGEPIMGKYQVHHLEYGDRSVKAKRVVPLHSSCHLHIHRITASVAEDGTVSFHGKVLDMLRQKGLMKEK